MTSKCCVDVRGFRFWDLGLNSFIVQFYRYGILHTSHHVGRPVTSKRVWVPSFGVLFTFGFGPFCPGFARAGRLDLGSWHCPSCPCPYPCACPCPPCPCPRLLPLPLPLPLGVLALVLFANIFFRCLHILPKSSRFLEPGTRDDRPSVTQWHYPYIKGPRKAVLSLKTQISI